MLEVMCFLMQFGPGQDAYHHPLGQHVAAHDRPRGLFAGLRQAGPVLIHGDESIADHALESICDGRGGNAQELSQTDADDRFLVPLEHIHEGKIIFDCGAKFIHLFCPNS